MIIARKKYFEKYRGFKNQWYLLAKCSAMEEDREIEEINFFNIKNEPILEFTDITEWSETKVREKIS